MDKYPLAKIPNVVFFQEGPGVRNTQYTSSGVKLLNVANLQEGQIDLSTSERYISNEEAYGKYKHFLVDDGDFIIASSGIKVEYFERKMGFIDQSHLPLCMNTSTIRFKALDNDKLCLRFFMYCLKTDFFKEQLQRQITGSAQLNFGPSHLKKMSIPLPSLSEQQHIAYKLDLVCGILAKQKRQYKLFDDLVKSKFNEMFGDPVTNPMSWETKKLDSLGRVGSSRRVFTTELLDNGIPFYRGTEVAKLSLGEVVQPKYYISETHYEELKKATGVPSIGDLLLPSICAKGEVWKVDTDTPFYFKDGRVLWIQLNSSDVDSEYLCYALSRKLISDFGELASGTTFAEMKIVLLKNIRLLVPPIEIQKRFATFMKATEKTKAKLKAEIEQTETLYKALMQKYFGDKEAAA